MVSFSKKREYIKWYKLAFEKINNDEIVPELNSDQIMKFVSENDWLIIPSKYELNKNQAKNRNNGNLWMSLGVAFGETTDNSKMKIGISFNNAKSISKLTELLTPFNINIRKKLLFLFSSMDDSYDTSVYKKVKKRNFAESPKYIAALGPIKTNQIKDSDIDLILNTSKKVSLESSEKLKESKELGSYYSEFPDISLVEVEFFIDENEFVRRILEIKQIYEICASIRESYEIIKSIKEEIKKIDDELSIFNDGLDDIENTNKLIEKKKKLQDDLALVEPNS